MEAKRCNHFQRPVLCDRPRCKSACYTPAIQTAMVMSSEPGFGTAHAARGHLTIQAAWQGRTWQRVHVHLQDPLLRHGAQWIPPCYHSPVTIPAGAQVGASLVLTPKQPHRNVHAHMWQTMIGKCNAASTS